MRTYDELVDVMRTSITKSIILVWVIAVVLCMVISGCGGGGGATGVAPAIDNRTTYTTPDSGIEQPPAPPAVHGQTSGLEDPPPPPLH